MAKKGKAPKVSRIQVEEMLRKCGGRVYITAARLEIHYLTLKKYIEVYDLKQVLREARGKQNDIAESVIARAMRMLKTEPKVAIDAAKFHLTHQAKNRGYVKEQKITGKDSSSPTPQVQAFNWDILSLDTRLKVLEELKVYQAAQEGPRAGEQEK